LYFFPLNFYLSGWIIRGFIGEGLGYPRDELVNWFRQAMDFLELGRQEWPNVPKDDRGAIFEKSFIQGVKRLHLNAYLTVRKRNTLSD